MNNRKCKNTGFYFRVLKEGRVSPTDTLIQLESHSNGITIAFANCMMHKEKRNFEGVRRILEVEALSTSWRKTFEKRLEGREVDPKARLEGISE